MVQVQIPRKQRRVLKKIKKILKNPHTFFFSLMKILIHISVAVGSEKCSATLDFGVLFPKLTHDVEYERYGRASGKCSFHLHHEGHCFPVPVRCVS